MADNTDYEPGLTFAQDGTITNNGSLEAIIRVKSNSQVKFSWATGFKETDQEAVLLSLKPNDDNGYWLKDAKGQAYVLLSPGETAGIELVSKFNGELVENDYMDSVIDVSANFQATQVLEEAIASEFGVALEDLVDYDQTRRQSGSLTRLYELINRNQ